MEPDKASYTLLYFITERIRLRRNFSFYIVTTNACMHIFRILEVKEARESEAVTNACDDQAKWGHPED